MTGSLSAQGGEDKFIQLCEKGNTMSIFRYLIFSLALLLLAAPFAAGQDKDAYDRTITLFRDSDVVKPFFKNSYGYAVFPLIGKAGVGIGGSAGKGQVYKNHRKTGTSTLLKLSIGFQLGGQVFSEIIFFQDERAYQEFISGSFAFDASASAVAVTAGAQATASSSGASAGVSTGPQTGEQLAGKYVKGMASFLHTKGGLMYEASIGGQTFSFEPTQ